MAYTLLVCFKMQGIEASTCFFNPGGFTPPSEKDSQDQ